MLTIDMKAEELTLGSSEISKETCSLLERSALDRGREQESGEGDESGESHRLLSRDMQLVVGGGEIDLVFLEGFCSLLPRGEREEL